MRQRQLQADSIDRLLRIGISLITVMLVFPQAGLSQEETNQPAQSDFVCTTEDYSAQIRWQAGRPRLTFGPLSASPSLSNAPVEASSRRGIVTYTTLQGEEKTAVFIYFDRTCAVTITDASGEIVVNELGTISGQISSNDIAPASADETLVSFQTSRNAVRVFRRSGETLMNVYNKDDRITWLNGVPATVEQTPEGTRYVNSYGEASVEVFIGNSGNLLLVIDGEAEEGF